MSAALQELLARLESAKAKPVAVEVPELGTLYFMPNTIGDVDEVRDDEDMGSKRGIARAMARQLCDEYGNRYGATPELVAALSAVEWTKLKGFTEALAPKA